MRDRARTYLLGIRSLGNEVTELMRKHDLYDPEGVRYPESCWSSDSCTLCGGEGSVYAKDCDSVLFCRTQASFVGAMAIADLVKTTLGPKGMVSGSGAQLPC